MKIQLIISTILIFLSLNFSGAYGAAAANEDQLLKYVGIDQFPITGQDFLVKKNGDRLVQGKDIPLYAEWSIAQNKIVRTYWIGCPRMGGDVYTHSSILSADETFLCVICRQGPLMVFQKINLQTRNDHLVGLGEAHTGDDWKILMVSPEIRLLHNSICTGESRILDEHGEQIEPSWYLPRVKSVEDSREFMKTI
ncbi:MAG: hypothetical protein WCG05_03050 [Alphaproteobacteria bacterium]